MVNSPPIHGVPACRGSWTTSGSPIELPIHADVAIAHVTSAIAGRTRAERVQPFFELERIGGRRVSRGQLELGLLCRLIESEERNDDERGAKQLPCRVGRVLERHPDAPRGLERALRLACRKRNGDGREQHRRLSEPLLDQVQDDVSLRGQRIHERLRRRLAFRRHRLRDPIAVRVEEGLGHGVHQRLDRDEHRDRRFERGLDRHQSGDAGVQPGVQVLQIRQARIAAGGTGRIGGVGAIELGRPHPVHRVHGAAARQQAAKPHQQWMERGQTLIGGGVRGEVEHQRRHRIWRTGQRGHSRSHVVGDLVRLRNCRTRMRSSSLDKLPQIDRLSAGRDRSAADARSAAEPNCCGGAPLLTDH